MFEQDKEYTKLITDLRSYKEQLLSNLIMVAEVPGEVGNTSKRAEIIVDRLSETDGLDINLDKKGNVVVELLSEHGHRNIAVQAHMDTHHNRHMDHTLQLFSDRAVGIGLADNSVGLATLMTLPSILQGLDIKLKSNLIFCFSSNFMDAGDLEGTRYFLDSYERDIHYGICVEGFPLGRLSYHALGLLRAEIHYTMSKKYDWSRFESTSSIVNIVNILNRILEIPLPSKPRTSILFTKLRSGISYDVLPSSANVQFQVRSESNEIVESIRREIEAILYELSLSTGATATLKVIANRRTGGLQFSHPLIARLHAIQKRLDLKPTIMPSTSDLCGFIDKGIPAVTLGLTNCDSYNHEDEVLYLDPIFTGIAQLIALLAELDGDLV